MYWDQLTSGQIDQVDKSIPVLLPVAATEQHGPHLPLSTDRMIGEHFCTELDKKQPDDVLILPTIGVGCSEHHLDFPGSLSVQHETLLRTITDQVSSVIHHGFRHVIVFNSHGGNQAIGQTFVETFGYR
ncbi:MAG: creatininase family protein, partial [Saprospiraceae bacterium]|nr:creatininase family protein [Saprospiraceae bacterium]